jgi:hypothetical protein
MGSETEGDVPYLFNKIGRLRLIKYRSEAEVNFFFWFSDCKLFVNLWLKSRDRFLKNTTIDRGQFL